MSAKSIGYGSVKLVAGSYTQALLTLSSSKQIIGIQSQDLTGDADDLVAEVDAISDTLSTIETTQNSIQDQMKEDYTELDSIDITEEESTYQTQLDTYQTLLTQYNALSTKPIAEIVLEVSTSTLSTNAFGSTYETLQGPFNLTEGTYSVCCSFMAEYQDNDTLPSVNIAIVKDGDDLQSGYRYGWGTFDGFWSREGQNYVVCSGAFQLLIPKDGLDVNLIIAGSVNAPVGDGRVANDWTPDFGLQEVDSSEYDVVKANPPQVTGSSRAIQIVKLNSDVNPLI